MIEEKDNNNFQSKKRGKKYKETIDFTAVQEV